MDAVKYSYIHNLIARKKSFERHSQRSGASTMQRKSSAEPKFILQDFDSSVDRGSTYMLNTQTPYLDDKHVNILIHTTLDSSMDSDYELQIKCSQNEEISILEEYV